MNGNKVDYLTFHLGPVQSFIETARTVRDLWSGSFLLSWLTTTAMTAAKQRGATILSPYNDGNELRKALEDDLVPCSPNRFLAECPADTAYTVAEECEKACRAEWKRIADQVRAKFHEKVVTIHAQRWADLWARDWDGQHGQIQEFFEIRTAVLARAEAEKMNPTALGIKTRVNGFLPFDVLAGLMDAQKSVRHVPKYSPKPDDHGNVSVKCSLFGSFEQLGPAEFNEAKEFWRAVTGKNSSYKGTRLGSSDKYCAVALVKRFAWAYLFVEELKKRPRDMRFDDTATVAASLWLDQAPELDRNEIREQHGYWSGQWLHATTPDEFDDADPCPPEVWQAIRDKKRANGRPPIYYVILKMDGDCIGKLMRGDLDDSFGSGPGRPKKISQQLITFALKKVCTIVEAKYGGQLIYSGGDDTLALLPAQTALACAAELRAEYRQAMKDNTISAGLAVVHIKEDLRFALQQARDAESASKEAGRDALTIAVCRRSGEHTSATLVWEQVETLQELVNHFTNDASDRWAYKLREEQPTLEVFAGPHWLAVEKEVDRLIVRGENAPSSFRQHVKALLSGYVTEMGAATRKKAPAEILNGFVTLCQSASFLARGRDS